uniref:Mediator of RNA polymerase II transcription subunit 21 n=2 Tax=Anopheles merus TaxID=30066 RepID=A0A182UZB9_ANOME
MLVHQPLALGCLLSLVFFSFPLFLYFKIVGKLDYSIVFEAMADRLTQLQDTVNQQAEHFCNSIGILQQCSVPSKFAGFERTGSQTPQQQVHQQQQLPQQQQQQQQQQQEDFPQLFSTLISRCAKDIDTLIESLPSEESSIELQVQSLQRLEAENKESAEKLEEIVRKGELLLEKIQAALSDIAQSQLDMQYSS